jgi:hypothetical protein
MMTPTLRSAALLRASACALGLLIAVPAMATDLPAGVTQRGNRIVLDLAKVKFKEFETSAGTAVVIWSRSETSLTAAKALIGVSCSGCENCGMVTQTEKKGATIVCRSLGCTPCGPVFIKGETDIAEVLAE